MMKVDRRSKKLVRLPHCSLPEAGWKEREDLQRMIRNSPEEFFGEMGEQLLLIGEEIKPASFVDDRIDLLAIDQEGRTVIIELKRGAQKLQLLQALSYAAMVSKWDTERILKERQLLTSLSDEEVESQFDNFLEESLENLNSSQRIILMAEGFDYEVMITAEWLFDQFEVDIRCYRLKLSVEGDQEFLSCSCIYPPPEITDHAIRRRNTTPGKVRWANWDEALSKIENQAVYNFFDGELKAGRQNYLPKRCLRYQVQGKVRFNLHARRQHAYVWQKGRFAHDTIFWTNRLGDHIDVTPVKRDICLRFHLATEADFQKFFESVTNELANTEFFTLHESSDGPLDDA